MYKAGVDCKYTAHSVRTASTSFASNKGIKLDTILKTVGRSKANTFAKYYKKSFKQDSYASMFLNRYLGLRIIDIYTYLFVNVSMYHE